MLSLGLGVRFDVYDASVRIMHVGDHGLGRRGNDEQQKEQRHEAPHRLPNVTVPQLPHELSAQSETLL